MNLIFIVNTNSADNLCNFVFLMSLVGAERGGDFNYEFTIKEQIKKKQNINE